MWWENIYDVIYLFDVVVVLASTTVYNRGVQPAALGPNAIQSGFLCRPLVRSGLRLCGASGWNLQRGPFYTYETVINREKLNEWTEVFVLMKQKNLSAKTNRQLMWTSQYEQTHWLWFQVSVSCWRLESISINFNKTPVDYFQYTLAPHRQPPRYHDRFNAVSPVLMHYLLLH